MDIARVLSFDPTDTLPGLDEAAAAQDQQLAATKARVAELRGAVDDVVGSARGKLEQTMALAAQAAEQGVGDNDLKRLTRQFKAAKAAFVAADQKQRFMAALPGLELDVDALAAGKEAAEAATAREADALRAAKAASEALRADVGSTAASVAQMHTLVEELAAAAAAQLDATAALLQQAEAAAAAAAAGSDAAAGTQQLQQQQQQPLLGPGPGLGEAQQLVEAEVAEARALEREIAELEARVGELDAGASSDRGALAALRAEADQLRALAGGRARAADADGGVRQAARLCEGVAELMARVSGVELLPGARPEELALRVRMAVPTSRVLPADKAPLRDCQADIVLQLQGAGAAARLAGVRLSPAAVDVADVAAAAPPGLAGITHAVREVRWRLLCHWQRKALVEAAAEVFPPAASPLGPPHVRVALPLGPQHAGGASADVDVLVPLAWPEEGAPRLAGVACAALPAGAADEVVAAVNADARLLGECDVLSLLQHVAGLLKARLPASS